MLYLIASIAGAAALIIILKLFELKGVNNITGITINYVVGAVLAFAFAPKSMTWPEIVSAPWFWFALLIGALFMLSFMVYAVSAQRSGVAITAISGRAAMAIPVIFAFFVLGEEVTSVKITMLALLILSLPLIIYKRKEDWAIGNKSIAWLVMLPVTVFLFNGVNDTLVQYTQKTLIPDPMENPIFMGTMFISGAVTGVLYYFAIYLFVARGSFLYRPKWRDLIWGSILGFANWVCMIGVLYALTRMDGSVFYPLYYSGAIVVSTIVGVWAFKEKLSPINYMGICVAIVAIVVLAMY